MTSKSSIVTDPANPHPGRILALEFLQPLDMSVAELARRLDAEPSRLSRVVNGKQAVTADLDLRLTGVFGLSRGFFLRLQNSYDLRRAEQAAPDLGRRLKPIEAGALRAHNAG